MRIRNFTEITGEQFLLIDLPGIHSDTYDGSVCATRTVQLPNLTHISFSDSIYHMIALFRQQHH